MSKVAEITPSAVFDSAIPIGQRERMISDYAELFGLRVSEREKRLLKTLLQIDPIAIDLAFVFLDQDTTALPVRVLKNSSRKPTGPVFVDMNAQIDFMTRSYGTPEVRDMFAKIEDSQRRFHALIGVVDLDVAFSSQEEFDAYRQATAIPTSQNYYDREGLADCARHDWNIESSHVYEFDYLDFNYLVALGLA